MGWCIRNCEYFVVQIVCCDISEFCRINNLIDGFDKYDIAFLFQFDDKPKFSIERLSDSDSLYFGGLALYEVKFTLTPRTIIPYM